MLKSIVVGGSGALGRALVNDLKLKGFQPINVDFVANDDAAINIAIDSKQSLGNQIDRICKEIDNSVSDSAVKGVFSTAGGWAGGNIKDDNFLETISQMNTMNLESAALAAHLSMKHLSQDGLLMLTGAQAALRPQADMIAYSLSKISTHYLVQSVASDFSFKERNGCAVSILPVTIDTPTNRMYMPDADFSSWTKVHSASLPIFGIY